MHAARWAWRSATIFAWLATRLPLPRLGARAALDWCAARSIRIGYTTGYTRPIMERLMPLAAAQGFVQEVMGELNVVTTTLLRFSLRRVFDGMRGVDQLIWALAFV